MLAADKFTDVTSDTCTLYRLLDKMQRNDEFVNMCVYLTVFE